MTQTASISSQNSVLLMAPLSGYLYPIDQVPDPVFAQKMVGDGIAIDPVSQSLLAPCEGEVVQIHPAHHAITVKTPEGIEVLMHIGLETVALRGEGLNPKVKEGDRVKTGDVLIEFDADYLAIHAKSLITVIVIANSDQVARFLPRRGSVTAGRDAILELKLGDQAETTDGKGMTVTSDPIVIFNPVGLHARPSAVLANLAKKYQSKITLKMGDQQTNARSVTGLMGLQVGNGATVHLVAQGEDAEIAIKELTEAIHSGLGEEVSAPAPASIAQSPLSEPPTPPPYPRSADPNIVLGAAASPGVGVGYLYQLRQPEIKVIEKGENSTQERRKLEKAINQAALEIEALRAKVHAQGDPSKAAIFAAHHELLEDPELIELTNNVIDKGKSAAYAWQQIFTRQAEILSNLDNELLAERANDLRDVGNRVLRILTGIVETETTYPDHAILVAEDLTPSDMANLDRSKVKGFATVGGGATSHVSIMARSMGIPAIAGTEPRVLDLADGTPVILDGTKGKLQLNPALEEMERVQNLQLRIAAKRQEDLAHTMEYALTQDGIRIEVVANIGSQPDAEEAVKLGAEGVGLLRTEFIFMERATAPSEDEQTAIYSGIAKVLGPERPLIIRTLDVGGDKPIPYIPIPPEENPFLGERGVRIGFDRPEILRTQIRAILRASKVGNVKVMFPMIGRLEEIQMIKSLIKEECQSLGVAPIETGIMVEIPAAAVMADLYAKEVDFFSVGTNDLTQYTLAMDRGHPKLAPYVDGLHPGVLRLIAQTVQGADKHGKWVGVCGGIGSDPQAIPILIGLGVKELSVSINSIPTIKALIRTLNSAECQKLAEQVLAAETGAEVRKVSPLAEI